MNFRIEKIHIEESRESLSTGIGLAGAVCNKYIGFIGNKHDIEEIRKTIKQYSVDVFLTYKQIDMRESYRESFHLPLPGEGTRVQIKFLEGLLYYIHWPQCPDREDILYGWIRKNQKLKKFAININGRSLSNFNPILLSMDANEVINYSPADAAKRLQQVFIGRKLFRHPKLEVKELKAELPVNTKDCPTSVNITLNIVFSQGQS